MLLRLTAKLLKVIGKPCSGQLIDTPVSPDDWYGNLLWIDGRKCVLLTHAGTMFSVFVPDISVADLRSPGRFFASRIDEALAIEALPPWTFGKLEPDNLQLANTASRVVLGCMNDRALLCEVVVDNAGSGMDRHDVDDLNRRLRRPIHCPPPGHAITGFPV